ncbi:MAG: SPOR domain-containing protein [Gammaproteobacteria bacterium]
MTTLSPAEAEVSGDPSSEGVEAVKAGWIVQLGVFRDKTNAITQQQRLQENGIRSDRESITFEDSPAWRIVLGPFDSKEEADRESGKAVLVTGERALVLLIDAKP